MRRSLLCRSKSVRNNRPQKPLCAPKTIVQDQKKARRANRHRLDSLYYQPPSHCNPQKREDGYAYLLIDVGSAFRAKHFEPKVATNIEAKINESRNKSLKLLFKAWTAAKARDTEAFRTHLLESVIAFENALDKELLFSRQALAEFHSIVLNAASMPRH